MNNDILGAKAGSLKKGITTKRQLDPLAPAYQYPGHSEEETFTGLPPASQLLKMSEKERKELLFSLRSSKNQQNGVIKPHLKLESKHIHPVEIKKPQNEELVAKVTQSSDLKVPAFEKPSTDPAVKAEAASPKLEIENLKSMLVQPTLMKTPQLVSKKQPALPQIFPDDILNGEVRSTGLEAASQVGRRSMPILEKRSFKPARFQRLTAHEQLNHFLVN